MLGPGGRGNGARPGVLGLRPARAGCPLARARPPGLRALYGVRAALARGSRKRCAPAGGFPIRFGAVRVFSQNCFGTIGWLLRFSRTAGRRCRDNMLTKTLFYWNDVKAPLRRPSEPLLTKTLFYWNDVKAPLRRPPAPLSLAGCFNESASSIGAHGSRCTREANIQACAKLTKRYHDITHSVRRKKPWQS
jgi:hypothetical protein